jgi:putative SOS response-associated peptidase YedK
MFIHSLIIASNCLSMVEDPSVPMTMRQIAQWVMPTLPNFRVTAKGEPKKSDPGVTNIRNAKSPHWRRWLGPESRCLVLFTSFSENELMPDGSRPPIWFAFGDGRPLSFFAGIWTRWAGVRKVKKGSVETSRFCENC